MRKILFVVPAFTLGGTATSLINLLSLLDGKYELYVFAIKNEGESIDEIATKASIIGYDKNRKNSQGRKTKKRIISFVKKILTGLGINIASRILKNKARQMDFSSYDAVIAFQEGYPTTFVHHSNAKKKIAWIHSIYSRLITVISPTVINTYQEYDKIVCVSETAKKDLVQTEPSLTSKAITIRNAIDLNKIKEKSNLFEVQWKETCIHIVSVGRIDPVKRFSMIPIIAKKIIDKGIDIQWHIIGNVAQEHEYKKLKDNISSNSMEDYVIIEGGKTNPYPYIKAANLLVCLSSSETFNYTLLEARLLNTPIITTDFPAAKEFVEDGTNGIISPIEQIADSIFELMDNPDKYKKLKEQTREYSYDTESIIEQFNHIF